MQLPRFPFTQPVQHCHGDAVEDPAIRERRHQHMRQTLLPLVGAPLQCSLHYYSISEPQ